MDQIPVLLLAGFISMFLGYVVTDYFITSEAIAKLRRRWFKLPLPKKSYSDRLGELADSLTKASRQVDEVLSELASVAKEREENVKGLEESLQLLEKREGDIKTRIEHLEKVPLPAVEHFAEIMNRGEKRSAKRDYMLFGAGVAVSTVISIGLKVFGLG